MASGRCRSRVGSSTPDVSLSFIAHVFVRGETKAGDVAVKEAEMYKQHRGNGREDADDGDEDERAGAGHRQQRRRRRRGVAHARVVGIVPRFVAVDEQGCVNKHQLAQGERGDRECDDERRRQAHQKRRIITATDAIVQPLAVVVETRHALVANGAMFGASFTRRYITKVASAILDDVSMLCSVELRYDRASWSSADLRIGRVQQQHRQMGQNVQQEQGGEQ